MCIASSVDYICVKEKKKRPSRRAPTAYMLYCNSQRPKVVAESPGIGELAYFGFEFSIPNKIIIYVYRIL